MSAYRFDVHAHYLMPTGMTLPSHGPKFLSSPMSHWTPEFALKFMDDHGIAVQMLSFPHNLGPTQARAGNEYGALLVEKYPDRFGLLASLPLTDVDAALEEIEYAFETLGADGVILMTNCDGSYLGDSKFEPIYHALNQRSATVFLHPTSPANIHCEACGRPGPIMEFPFDTCHSVGDMLYAGVFERYTSIRFILSHAGGALPTLAPRIATIGTLSWAPHRRALTEDSVLKQLSGLYFDTAIAGSRAAILPLLELTSSDHIVFGTDFPPASVPVIERNISWLDALDILDPKEVANNARSLFPRFCQVPA